jgi:hypothetical protein
MMTREEIRTELGWSENMIHSLLPISDSTHARRNKHTGGYTSGLYRRDRVLAVAESEEGQAAQERWDEKLRSDRPDPGWTTRLGDIGRPLATTAIAAGKLLELSGYRANKHVTDAAVAVGCGARRWDGLRCTATGTRSVRWLRSGQRLKTQASRKSPTCWPLPSLRSAGSGPRGGKEV